MPYRITITWDMPDLGPDGTIDGIRKAVQSKSDAEEAIAKLNGDFQADDVEWYGFDEKDELETLGWTWNDEEILREMQVTLDVEGGVWTMERVTDILRGECDDEEQMNRIAEEAAKRRKE